MRLPLFFIITAASLAALPVCAASQPANTSLNTINTKPANIQQMAATETTDVEVNFNLPDLNKINTSTGSVSSGLILKPLPFTPPIIPPEMLKGPAITNIRLAVGQDRLEVAWLTDIPATGKVSFGPTDQYGIILENTAMATSHELTMPIKPGILHFRLSSIDSNKKESTTPDMTVEIPTFEALTPQTTNAQTTDEKYGSEATETLAPPPQEPDANLIKQTPTAVYKDTPLTQSTPITATDAVLGGVAVLLLGILVGMFLPRRKAQ